MRNSPPTAFRRWLQRSGIPQREVARRLGVTAGQVSRWATGPTRPSEQSLQRVADAFGVSVDEIMREPANDPGLVVLG